MSQKVFFFPVVRSTKVPLQFTLEPADERQSSLVAGCGHRVWHRDCLVLDGMVRRPRSKPNFPRWVVKLPRCLQRPFTPKKCVLCEYTESFQKTIRCAYCGHAIFPGDQVSTYVPGGNLEAEFVAKATCVQSGFIGCMSADCVPTAGFYAGLWSGEGIFSSFSAGTVAAEAILKEEIVALDT